MRHTQINPGVYLQRSGTSLAVLILMVLAVAAQPAAQAAEPVARAPAAERPKIGLVLGGGGARGAAHIGVLQELERMRVPIDAIVGTSMGAIVGGLYASGMTADELEELVGTLDWKDALSDRGDRIDLSFRRKQDEDAYPIRFELGLREGELQLPQGVLQGQKLDLVLRELTLDSSHIRDFDDLGIPFRAVASDLVSGEHYVMGSGDLALAIRASMSVPGAFAPVQVDDRLLVDGGLVGNLAVEVMQEMGVDVIIAVDVEFPLYTKDELISAVGISEQVLTILIRRETLRQIEKLGPDDVLIQPELGIFPSTNFFESVSMIEPGIEATRARGSQLQRYAVSAEEYEQLSARRRVTPMPSETIDFIRVKHDGRVSPQLLERRMQLKEGDPIDPQTLSTEANRLYGLQVFEKVGYQLLEEGDQLGVVFTATTKRWGPGFLRFGLSIEDDFEGSTAFNMATRLWWPGINSLGAEWRSDLRLGTDPLVATEFYQPLRTDSRIFIAPHISLGQRNLNLFDAGEAVAELRLTELSFGIDAGAELGTYGELRIGAYRGYSDASVKVGDPGIEDLKLDTGGLLASVKIDTRDDAQFARSGTQAELIWNLSRPSLGADRHYDTVAFNVDSAWSRGRHTLALGVQFGKSLDARSALHEHFSLGGFLRMSGLERGALSGPYSGLARLVYYRRVGNLTGGLLELPVYLGASLETGNVWESRAAISFESLRTNGSLFIGIDSYFGPIYLAAGFAEGGRNNFYLFVGAKPR